MKSGRFIVLEGIDGSGTSTQIKLLANFLINKGFKVFCSKEPTDSPLGHFIRQTLKENIQKEPRLLAMLALCFAADRLQHIHNIILPKKKEYDFILLDRYYLSSLVYQGLHLKKSFIKDINQWAIEPDLTIILDVDVNIALKRLEKRNNQKDFYETKEFLEKIRKDYLNFLNKDNKNIVLIDSSKNESDVLNYIINALNYKWEDVKNI